MPIKIYSNARGAPTPALNAVASVMLVFSLLAIVLAVLVVGPCSGRVESAPARPRTSRASTSKLAKRQRWGLDAGQHQSSLSRVQVAVRRY